MLGAYGTYEDTVRLDGDDLRLFGAVISPALMSALGARPLVGRVFTAADAEAGADRVVLLSESLWRERFSSDPGRRRAPAQHRWRAAHVIVGVVVG